jgi:hypothetical protein
MSAALEIIYCVVKTSVRLYIHRRSFHFNIILLQAYNIMLIKTRGDNKTYKTVVDNGPIFRLRVSLHLSDPSKSVVPYNLKD